MKYFLLSVITFSICATSFAADEWKTYFKNEEVEILYRYAACHDETNGIHQQKVFFKFVNLTGKKEEIIFFREYFYSSSEKGKADKAGFTVELNPNEVKEGECATQDRAFFIYSKQLNFASTELKKFELKDIHVKIIG